MIKIGQRTPQTELKALKTWLADYLTRYLVRKYKREVDFDCKNCRDSALVNERLGPYPWNIALIYPSCAANLCAWCFSPRGR